MLPLGVQKLQSLSTSGGGRFTHLPHPTGDLQLDSADSRYASVHPTFVGQAKLVYMKCSLKSYISRVSLRGILTLLVTLNSHIFSRVPILH